MPAQTQTLQTGRDAAYAFAEQVDADTLATVGEGKLIPFSTVQPMTPSAARIQNTESLNTGMTRVGRRGRESVSAQVTGQMGVGPYDPLLAAVMRTTEAASATITQAEVGGAIDSVSGRTVTFAAGADAIAAGLRVGEVVVFTEGLDAADLNKALVVTDATATTLTFAQSLTGTAGSATSSLARRRKLVNGTELHGFTVEERRAKGGTVSGEVMRQTLIGRTTLGVQPGQNLSLQMALQGLEYLPRIGDGAYFTDPDKVPLEPMTEAYARLIFDGQVVGKLSSWNCEIDPRIITPQTVGRTAEALGYGSTTMTGSFTVLHEGAAALQKVIDEDNVPLGIHVEDPIAGGFTVYSSNVRLLQVSKSQLGNDDFSTATYEFECGQEERGGAFEKTMATLSFSEAA